MSRQTKVSVAIAAALALAGARSAAAQSLVRQGLANADTVSVKPIVLTVSGGISRGSYQGGLNWAIVEFARRTSFDPAFRNQARAMGTTPNLPPLFLAAAAGASAGNINVLLSAFEWCRKGGSSKPEDSPFWKAWVWTGWDQLMSNKDSLRPDEHALFDRKFISTVLKADLESDLATIPFRPSCKLPLGITVTRLRPEEIAVSAGIHASSQRFAMPFVFRTDSVGAAYFTQPSDTVRIDPTLGEMILSPDLPPDTLYGGKLSHVFPVVEASSAFPLAFAPRTLGYIKADSVEAKCPRNAAGTWLCVSVDSAQFVDGGVFDNNPLGVAFGLYRCMPYDAAPALLVPNGESSARVCENPGKKATMIYMDPDARRDANGALRSIHRDNSRIEGLSFVNELATSFISTGREYELAVFARTYKFIKGSASLSLVATNRYQAIVGDHLAAFGAFLGRPFRESDFFAGVYDGAYFIGDEWLCAKGDTHRSCIRGVVQGVICGNVFELDNPARVGMALLYRQEFGESLTCAAAQLPPVAKPITVSYARARVFRAIGGANDEIRRVSEKQSKTNPDPFRCRPKRFVEKIVCGNGFEILLDSLRTDTIAKFTSALKSAPECAEGSPNYLSACRMDSTLIALAEDPVPAADEILRDSFRRLAFVESGHELESKVDAIEAAYYFERSSNLRGWATFTPTIPNDRGGLNFVRVIPFHVSTAFGHRSFIAGWQPGYFCRCGLRYFFPIDLSTTRRQLNSPGGVLDTRVSTVTVGFGAAIINGGTFLHSVQLSSFVSLRNPHETGGAYAFDRRLGGEASMSILLSRIRLGVRVLPRSDRGSGNNGRIYAMIGFDDFAGTMYWAGRLSH